MRPTEDTFEKWNEAHAEKHDLDKFYNHPNSVFRYIENKRINKLIELAFISDSDKVLEVGCGVGHILERVPKGNLYGIDISDIQVKRATARLKGKAIIIKAPGEHIPYEDKFFDRILCSEVIEHVLDPVKLLLEIKRVLKDDGILSLSIPNENLINFTKNILQKLGLSWIIAPKKSEWDLAAKNNLDEWHLHEFNLKLIRECNEGIFKEVKIRSIPNPILPFRYVLALKKHE
jgi:ubiquinone/menaquinone biosynthesis C-methylase UbiE